MNTTYPTEKATASPAAQEYYGSGYPSIRALIDAIHANGLPGYCIDVDPMCGSVCITHKGVTDPASTLAAYATPWWEHECNLPFQVVDDAGEIVDLDGLPHLELEIHYTGDVQADAKAWAAAVLPMCNATLGVQQST